MIKIGNRIIDRTPNKVSDLRGKPGKFSHLPLIVSNCSVKAFNGKERGRYHSTLQSRYTHLQSRGSRRVDFVALEHVQSVVETSGISSRSPGSWSWLLRTLQLQIQSWKET